MDFKSIINKIDSMSAPTEVIKAPTLPASIQLNEDAQLRVLSGQTSIVSEAKKMQEDEMKVGDTKKSSTGGTITKTKTGVTHTAKKYGGDEKKADEDDSDDKKNESIKEDSDAQKAARAKFLDMVKGKKGDKKADKKADKKGDDVTEAVVEKTSKKKTVKESVETKLTFKDMIKLVQESGGQQQIDPVDTELFAWAQRVAKSKFQESVRQDAYAGLVYERMGGVFEMYDVLAEDTK